MTRGALPPCVFPLARGLLGSCMGLEGTWGPVLHPSPPWNGMDKRRAPKPHSKLVSPNPNKTQTRFYTHMGP